MCVCVCVCMCVCVCIFSSNSDNHIESMARIMTMESSKIIIFYTIILSLNNTCRVIMHKALTILALELNHF